ncbi:MAG: hypothetical protein ACREJ3_14555, partial [Polyangiaceae bacterium]
HHAAPTGHHAAPSFKGPYTSLERPCTSGQRTDASTKTRRTRPEVALRADASGVLSTADTRGAICRVDPTMPPPAVTQIGRIARRDDDPYWKY